MPAKLRTVFLLPRIATDGPTKGVLWLAKYLDPRVFDVRVVGMSPAEETAAALFAEVPHITYESLEVGKITDLRAGPRLFSWLRRRAPDCLVTSLPRADLWGILAGRVAGVKTIVSMIRNEDDKSLQQLIGSVGGLLSGCLFRWLYRRTSGVIAVSTGVRAYLVDRLKLRSERVWVLRNGVDIDYVRSQAGGVPLATRAKYGIPAGAPLLLTVGRLSEQKGLESLLKAAALVIERVPGATLVLAGDGPDREHLLQLAHQMRIEPNVRVLGYVRDIYPLMAAADVFVLPSIWEGMPRALLEAMAIGCPCIATRIGGSEEIVEDGVSGLLVPPGDSESLCSAIETLLADPTRREALASAAQRAVEESFSAKAIAAEFSTLLTFLSARTG